MTAILEFKQKMKDLYGRFEIYLMPIIKFVLALLYFVWINANMGYMTKVNNIFVVVVLALICSILPASVMTFFGFFLMIVHAYALGIETAVFMLALILFMMLAFLRFSVGQENVLALAPLTFSFDVQALLPIGSGLLGNALSAIPAGCGIVLYYFIRFIRSQSEYLTNADVDLMEKVKVLSDGLIQNWAMWVTVIAVVITVLVVNFIRTRSINYAWRIAIFLGGIVYAAVIFSGSFFFEVTVHIPVLLIYTSISVVIGLILEFFVFGGNYARTERLSYEDDEYYYYVKAVPKASISTTKRSIKKITAEALEEAEEDVYANPIFKEEKSNKDTKTVTVDDIDFERKLEESLRDL